VRDRREGRPPATTSSEVAKRDITKTRLSYRASASRRSRVTGTLREKNLSGKSGEGLNQTSDERGVRRYVIGCSLLERAE